MRPVHTEPFEDAELQLGWPTWDESGEQGRMSVKYAYPDSRGHTSRGAPEVPVEYLVPMLRLAIRHGALRPEDTAELLRAVADAVDVRRFPRTRGAVATDN